jgi:hypothetical protein
MFGSTAMSDVDIDETIEKAGPGIPVICGRRGAFR